MSDQTIKTIQTPELRDFKPWDDRLDAPRKERLKVLYFRWAGHMRGIMDDEVETFVKEGLLEEAIEVRWKRS